MWGMVEAPSLPSRSRGVSRKHIHILLHKQFWCLKIIFHLGPKWEASIHTSLWCSAAEAGSCFSAGGKLIKFPLVMESLSGWAQGWSAFVPAGPSASRLWLTQVKMCRKYTLYSRFGRRYKNHKLCPSPQIPPQTSPPLRLQLWISEH